MGAFHCDLTTTIDDDESDSGCITTLQDCADARNMGVYSPLECGSNAAKLCGWSAMFA